MRAGRRASVLLLTAVVGCGGSDSPDPIAKEEFVRRADAICASYEARNEALAKVDPRTWEESAVVAEKGAALDEEKLGKLRDLPPSRAGAQQADAYFDALERLDENFREYARLVRDRPLEHRSELKANSAEGHRLSRQVIAAATGFGFRGCGIKY